MEFGHGHGVWRLGIGCKGACAGQADGAGVESVDHGVGW